MVSPRSTLLICLLALGSLAPRPGGAQQEAAALARRIADVASIALAEYAEGVTDGEIVSQEELSEAVLFLEEARRSAAGLDAPARDAALQHLERIAGGVNELAPVGRLRGELAQLRAVLEKSVGVALDPLPTDPPSLARGERLYRQYCASCHGADGSGDGALAAGMDPPPADLADRGALRSTAPVDFFRKINVGVAGTAMPGFADRIELDDRWALALYASRLRASPVLAAAGAVELSERCLDCALLVSDFHATALLNDDSLGAALAGPSGISHDDSALVAIVAYARVAGSVEELGGDRRLRTQRVVRQSGELAGRAVDAALEGETDAARRLALDAYLEFEAIESAVRARDAGASRRVEQAFAGLRGAIESGADEARLTARRGAVDSALDEAAGVLTARASPSLLFGQSLVIMLREGLEAILIIGALVAFLVKAGAAERRREIGLGVLAALGASLLTAVGFATVFRSAPAQQEVLEGVTMLVAAAVLFWVSYWLISKVELRKWQHFVSTQMSRALTSRSAWALAAVAFLAVYREGFETVLFYAALFTTSDGTAAATGGIVAGMAVGVAALALVYFAIERFGVRLPLKPFFIGTSALLYVMAFSFAGKGVSELQEAGVISITPLEWLPSLPLLGIFPTYQTVLIQAFVAAALGAALVWVFWLEPLRERVGVVR